MNHLAALRAATLVTALAALSINVVVLRMALRTRRRLNANDQFKVQALYDAWRGGLEMAAQVVGKLAEGYSEPGRNAVLDAERVIHQLIHEARKWSPP